MKIFFSNKWLIGTGTAVLAVLITYFGFGIGKATPQEIYNVSSVNQVGGITVGKITVGTSPRHITQENMSELEKFLPQDRKLEIQVWHLMGDAESKQYASEIKSYLENNGWKVDPFLGSFLWARPVIGVEVKNLASEGRWRFEVGSASQ